MLPLIAAVAFALFAMAALSVDLGLAAVQQARLETAAEAAAAVALREEARMLHELALERLPDEDADCAREPECREQRAREAALALDDELLAAASVDPPTAEIRHDATRVRRSLDGSCGEGCWSTRLEQAIPLLFGQASLLSFEGTSVQELLEARSDGALLDPDSVPGSGPLRSGGVPVAGAGRSEAHPALRVGAAVSAPRELPGRSAFALEIDYWTALPADATQVLEVDGERLVPVSGAPAVGLLLARGTGYVVGEILRETFVPEERGSGPAYVPLYDPEFAEGRLLVGFGSARIDASDPARVGVTRLAARVAPANASASPRGLSGVGDRIEPVLRAQQAAAEALLLAPVLR
jgi:hypothetical protein